MAMIKSTEYIKNERIKGNLVLQIHDELIFEVNKYIVKTFENSVKEIMENVVMLKVPLKVNSGTGENLGELK